MALETFLRLFIVRFQGGFKYAFKIVRVGRWSGSAILAHRAGLNHVEGMNYNVVDGVGECR